MEKMYGYVYLTTCDITLKMYIGRRKWNKQYTEDEYNLVPKDIKDKFESKFNIRAFPLDSEYLGSGKLLLEAIKEYGKNHFTVDILDVGWSRSDLIAKETYWINKFLDEGYDMYNIARNGNTGFDPDEMDDDRYNQYVRHMKHLAKELDFASRFPDSSGSNNGRYGKPVSEITRLRISKANKGRVQSPEERESRRRAHMEKCPNVKPPDCTGSICLNNGKVNKKLWPDQLDEFLKANPEWKRGMIRKNVKN